MEVFRMKISKGKIGAAGAIFTGIGLIAKAIVDGDYSHLPEAIAMIFGGLSLYGIRVKFDE